MTQADYGTFVDQLDRLAVLFRAPGKVQTIAGEYWTILQRLSLPEFLGRVTRWIETQDRFPTPAALRRLQGTGPPPRYDYPVATPAELARYRAAEARGWEDDPCGCLDCLAADVATAPRRFVPLETPTGETSRRCVDETRQRAITLGEWLHGGRLRRWRDAQAAFYEGFYRLIQDPPRHARLERLEAVAARALQEPTGDDDERLWADAGVAS